ncbi:MAG TPA: glycosyltransferase [Candidatus Saccharimonadales bacterium]|nr:glycosyltransferase [Candidatus Saccharimonadales bacterium]
MSNIFVYRNCFTGDVSGGDMHTGGVCEWIDRNCPEHALYLIHAANDGQEKAFQETQRLRQITYPDTSIKNPALMFPLRALKANRVALPWHHKSNLFIAGAHFTPDVWPALGQGKRAPGAIRAVYIHHIIQDMPRPASLNTVLANLQEQFCFNLIKHHFDKIITVNESVVEGLRRRGFTQPILVSSNFVNDHNVKPIAYTKKDITLAFTGRLVTQKGIDDFVYACEVLQPSVPNFKAVMIGAGPEISRLKRTIAAKKLQIDVTGFVSEKRKFGLLARSQFFVFPSIEEGWGIAIAEALSVGTPVVAYDLPVYQEPFGGVIQTVTTGDRKKLIKRITNLLTTYDKNASAYTKAQRALVERAANFTRDTVARKEFDFLLGEQHG